MSNIIPEIQDRIELVQILLYLSDLHDKTPHQNIDNREYCEAIEKWFTPYKSHDAVAQTKELIIHNHFNYTRPHEAAIRFNEIIADVNDPLHSWAMKVQDFSNTSNYPDFIKRESCYYDWILSNIKSCDFDSWVTFIEKYFYENPREFHLIICPLDGNYGLNIKLNQMTVSFHICCVPLYDPDGNAEWHLDYLAKGMAHEYGHCFVNPVVEKYQAMLESHNAFFASHKNVPDYYNLDYAVICEYFVRAFAIRFMEKNTDKFPNFNIASEYERQRKTFICIDKFVKALAEYEKCNMSFADFYKNNINGLLNSI